MGTSYVAPARRRTGPVRTRSRPAPQAISSQGRRVVDGLTVDSPITFRLRSATWGDQYGVFATVMSVFSAWVPTAVDDVHRSRSIPPRHIVQCPAVHCRAISSSLSTSMDPRHDRTGLCRPVGGSVRLAAWGCARHGPRDVPRRPRGGGRRGTSLPSTPPDEPGGGELYGPVPLLNRCQPRSGRARCTDHGGW